MKNNFYIKSVLTVIAICLVILTAKNVSFISTANAETNSTNSNYALVPVNADGSINVVVTKLSDEVDVNITGVNGGYVPYGQLPVEIKENDDK